MNRSLLISLPLLFLALPTQAEKRKHSPTPVQPINLNPDPYLIPMPAAQPLMQQPEVTVVRHRGHVTGKRGIDVSHYQSHIDWQTVARNNDVTYVYIKVTENAGLVDRMFQTNHREARRAGIPVGCYHFFSPTASPMAQLKNLTSAVPHLRDHDLVPMIDVEVKGKKTTPEALRSRLRQFLRGVEDYYGVRPIIYTGQNFYNKYLAGHFDEYLFMIAKYSEGIPELHGSPRFALWQYSANGHVEGIKGAVDQSCFMDNYSLRDILIKKKK